MMKSIDFDPAARYYDAFVRADFDVAFWVQESSSRQGRCLELMCGTGRLSLPILRAGRALTCADYSRGLLDVLRERVKAESLPAEVVEMDARELSFADPFDFIFIGFHAFSELSTDQDAAAALASIRRCLSARGSLMCSLQNPAQRRAALTGEWKDFGDAPLPGTPNRVAVRGRYQLREDDLVVGEQVYRELDPQGREVGGLVLPLKFRLYDEAHFRRLADAEGFAVTLLYGDYDRSSYDPERSPFAIYELRVR